MDLEKAQRQRMVVQGRALLSGDFLNEWINTTLHDGGIGRKRLARYDWIPIHHALWICMHAVSS